MSTRIYWGDRDITDCVASIKVELTYPAEPVPTMAWESAALTIRGKWSPPTWSPIPRRSCWRTRVGLGCTQCARRRRR